MNVLEKNLETFIKVLNLANSKSCTIILSGSTSLALQGVDIAVNDIDIVTDEKGAFILDGLLAQYRVKDMEYSETEKYKSFFGIYEIDGIKVEVMGEFQYRLKDGNWSVANHLHPIHYINYQGAEIPVLCLQQELVEYENAEKVLTISRIKERLNP